MIRLADPARVGPALGSLRRIHRLTQRQLAEAGGMRQNQISAWESGAVLPGLDSLIRYAAALGYDVVLMPREHA